MLIAPYVLQLYCVSETYCWDQSIMILLLYISLIGLRKISFVFPVNYYHDNIHISYEHGKVMYIFYIWHNWIIMKNSFVSARMECRVYILAVILVCSVYIVTPISTSKGMFLASICHQYIWQLSYCSISISSKDTLLIMPKMHTYSSYYIITLLWSYRSWTLQLQC